MPSSPLRRLAAERTLYEGDVAPSLEGAALSTPGYQIARDAFLLEVPGGLRFHYRRGLGTCFARKPRISDAEVALFFEGSVAGAIAWINGFVPLHASAIVHDGRVHAFTGTSGAGKSTLAAALAAHGMTLFCDDVLVLDLSDPAQIVALPGPRRLKLWSDAIELTGRRAGGTVRPGLDKHYVTDGVDWADDALPLARLYCLEDSGSRPAAVLPIVGIERFAAVQHAYYRPHFCAALAGQEEYFRAVTRVANGIDIASFRRPRDVARFAQDVELVVQEIRGERG